MDIVEIRLLEAVASDGGVDLCCRAGLECGAITY